MEFKNKDEFIKLLQKNNIKVKDGMILLEDADQVGKYYYGFLKEKALKEGLPVSLAKFAKKSYKIDLDHFERNNQDWAKYSLTGEAEEKCGEDGECWNGWVKGKLPNIYLFLIKECDLDPQYVESELLEMVKDPEDYCGITG